MHDSMKKAYIAIIGVSLLVLIELLLSYFISRSADGAPNIVSLPIPHNGMSSVTFLALGDVNLGRKVGQRILRGDINHPFEKIQLKDDSADFVFVNLESQLSNQNGETVSPISNIVFTGPPDGAITLRNAGISLVSTANNHAFDYGKRALFETIDNLRSQNVLSVGTSKHKDSLFLPLIVEKNRIKIAIFAVTAFVNFSPDRWEEMIAPADTVQLLRSISEIRDHVDVVIVSYHGGIEYVTTPSDQTKEFADWCVKHGADIFLGHHPHVPFGIQQYGSKFVVHSLGNFVFYQPQYFWTQRSYGVKFQFDKIDTVTKVTIGKIIPWKVGLQTERLLDSNEVHQLQRRTQNISNFDLSPYWN